MADHFCYVCGDVGYAELIITCSKCKVVREHLDIPRRNKLLRSLLDGNMLSSYRVSFKSQLVGLINKADEKLTA
ncbi:hypothetical protein SDJN03_20346, partial [Cucurbita argyrosperma subsp. sororia]